MTVLGLRTVIYHVPDLKRAKEWYSSAMGVKPSVEHFIRAGASLKSPIQDVGQGIRVATVADPFGNLVGLIENPHFVAP